MVARVLQVFQLLLPIAAFVGPSICQHFGYPLHPAIQWLNENAYATLGVAFVLGQLGASLTATGAFEVYLTGEQLFSKLATGHVPHVREIAQALLAAGFQPDPRFRHLLEG